MQIQKMIDIDDMKENKINSCAINAQLSAYQKFYGNVEGIKKFMMIHNPHK